jgi:ABC-type transport system substrate-binding protein
MNYTDFIQAPLTGLIRHRPGNLQPPAGKNRDMYCDQEMDKLFDQRRNTFDPAAQTAVLQKIDEKYVDVDRFLMVTHDVNPRAMNPKVKGFAQARNWFQAFSPMTMVK